MTVINGPPTSLGTREFSGVDAKRIAVALFVFAVLSAINWFLLLAVQSLLVPKAPGANAGPWLIRPIYAIHFGATAIMVAATAVLIIAPLRKKWAREDAALGTRFDPLREHRSTVIRMAVKSALLFVIYSASLVFYLFSWTIVSPEGIDQHLPWTTRHHGFQQVASLEYIPAGQQSDSTKQMGPWYNVTFQDGYLLGCERQQRRT